MTPVEKAALEVEKAYRQTGWMMLGWVIISIIGFSIALYRTL